MGINLRLNRSVVERYFGRIKCYRSILQLPYRCNKCSIEVLAKICIGLTNLEIKTSPIFLEGHCMLSEKRKMWRKKKKSRAFFHNVDNWNNHKPILREGVEAQKKEEVKVDLIRFEWAVVNYKACLN